MANNLSIFTNMTQKIRFCKYNNFVGRTSLGVLVYINSGRRLFIDDVRGRDMLTSLFKSCTIFANFLTYARFAIILR